IRRRRWPTHKQPRNKKYDVAKYDVGGVLLDRPFKIRRLGHFGFDNVAMAESLTFYTDLLGFRLSDILDFNRVVRDKKTIEGLGDTNGYMLRYSTCLGVGRPRGLFFQQGDEVVLTIGNLGTLRTPIIRDTEP